MSKSKSITPDFTPHQKVVIDRLIKASKSWGRQQDHALDVNIPPLIEKEFGSAYSSMTKMIRGLNAKIAHLEKVVRNQVGVD
jgi:hypothetical protein